jgi:hypothetical protein
MNTASEIVKWTEELCDLMESLEPDLFNNDWRKVSMPASVAAVRVLYYIGGLENTTNTYYRQLHHLLTTDSERWNNLMFQEKKALLARLGIPSVMVYV